MRDPARAVTVTLAAVSFAAACGRGPSSREIEPGVREIRNDMGRFVFVERAAWERKPSAGLAMRIAPHPDGLEILEVFEGGPAAKGGLLPGDVLTEIEGRSARGMSLEVAVAIIRGRPGSRMTLSLASGAKTLRRDDRYRPFTDFPEGAKLRADPAPAPGGSCAPRSPDNCLLLIASAGQCHYACP